MIYISNKNLSTRLFHLLYLTTHLFLTPSSPLFGYLHDTVTGSILFSSLAQNHCHPVFSPFFVEVPSFLSGNFVKSKPPVSFFYNLFYVCIFTGVQECHMTQGLWVDLRSWSEMGPYKDE